MPRPSNDLGKRSQGQDTDTLGTMATLRRPSLDMLQIQDNPEFMLPSTENQSEEAVDGRPTTPFTDGRYGSVRSILRDPNTPGTGQNVRFFSRDAYKVISPDQSMDMEFRALMQNQAHNTAAPSLERTNPDSDSPSVLTRASQGKSSRPTVAEIFSPLNDDATSPAQQNRSESDSLDHVSSIPALDFMGIFDSLTEHVDLPVKPPGLGFDVEEPPLNTSMDLDVSNTDGEHERGFSGLNKLTSTPYRDKGKGKAKEKPLEEEKENIPLPIPIDESIFHADEKPPRFPSILHDRSQSFSFGQTV